MQIKTIKKIITLKLNEWLASIEDKNLAVDVKKNIVVSGGCITSMLQKQPVNDYDIYLKDMDVLYRLAKYYCPNAVLDGRDKQNIMQTFCHDKYGKHTSNIHIEIFNTDNSEFAVRLKTIKGDQIKLDIASAGINLSEQLKVDEQGTPLKYQPIFLSQNAISLTDDIQIVLRFNGSVEKIHSTFDFIHATNYFTFDEGLVLNVDALACILTKTLRYQGSHYPLTSIIRMKKFLLRDWNINAGEMLKIMFQISELDLKNIEVLEEQLIGVDVAYFAKLIEVLKGVKKETMTSNYISEIINRVFNDYDEEE